MIDGIVKDNLVLCPTILTIWRFPKSWGYPQFIQVMGHHHFVFKPMVIFGDWAFWGIPRYVMNIWWLTQTRSMITKKSSFQKGDSTPPVLPVQTRALHPQMPVLLSGEVTINSVGIWGLPLMFRRTHCLFLRSCWLGSINVVDGVTLASPHLSVATVALVCTRIITNMDWSENRSPKIWWLLVQHHFPLAYYFFGGYNPVWDIPWHTHTFDQAILRCMES